MQQSEPENPFKIKKLVDDAVIPEYATSGSSGMDISSIEEVEIPSKDWKVIKTGMKIK